MTRVQDPVTRAGGGALVPALALGTCQVWWAGIDDVRPEHDALLADADLARRDRLRLAADRQRLTAAWAVARLVLGAAAGVAPDELRIDRRCPDCGAPHGKPRLSTDPDLQLSVAHSGRCVAVAVARRSPVGVDVEAVVQLPRADLDLLAGGALAGEERAELDRCPAEHRAAAFTTYWTRKEAVLKATGDGLSKPLETLVVSPPSSPPRVLRWPPTAAPVAGLSMHDLHPPTGSVATLAVLTGGPVRVEEYDAGPLLRRAVARPTAAQSSRRLSGDTTRSQRYP